MQLLQRRPATLLVGIFLSMIHSVSGGALDPYRAKNRLVVASLPPGASRDSYEMPMRRDGIRRRGKGRE